MKHSISALIFTLGLSSASAWADDLDQIPFLTQDQFRDVSEDLGAALSYKPLGPAEPLGLTGFDIGLEVTATQLKNQDSWDAASSGDAPDTLFVPKLHITKGLPFNIDVGAMYSAVPDSNISLLGAELRYAILPGGTASPALAIRGTYTKLSGVDQLDLDTKGVELSISKGFAMITPYAGIGRIWVDSQPDTITLSDESFQQNKVYVGANFNLAVINIGAEYDRTDGINSYGLKVGLRF